MRVRGLFRTIFHAEYVPLAKIMNYFIMNYSLQGNTSFLNERWKLDRYLLMRPQEIVAAATHVGIECLL